MHGRNFFTRTYDFLHFPSSRYFFQIFLFFKKLSKHFFLFKVIFSYKTLFKRLYLQHSYYLNQNFCYFSAAAPRCVKNLTYAWYLINLCKTPSLFTVLNKLSTHSCPPRPIIYPILSPLLFKY